MNLNTQIELNIKPLSEFIDKKEYYAELHRRINIITNYFLVQKYDIYDVVCQKIDNEYSILVYSKNCIKNGPSNLMGLNIDYATVSVILQ